MWDGSRKVTFVFPEPEEDDPDDFGLWGIYDMGKWRWKLEASGPLKGLATSPVPRDCFWIARRRAERDSIHEGPTRKIAIDCTKCAACCQDNEVLLQPEDIKRLKDGRPARAREGAPTRSATRTAASSSRCGNDTKRLPPPPEGQHAAASTSSARTAAASSRWAASVASSRAKTS